MTALPIPVRLEDLTPEFLTSVIAPHHPGVVVESFELLDVKRYGDVMVSTSDRLRMQLNYAAGSPRGLPRISLVKMKRSIDDALGMLYATEVGFYNRLRPQLDIEAPHALGGICDVPSARFYLLLEDLSQRGATFPNVTVPISLTQVRAVLDQLARLHGMFWNSPRLNTDLRWYQTHVTGPLYEFTSVAAPRTVAAEVTVHPLKQQLVAATGMSLDELWRGLCVVQRHQATLAQTILHGDCHIGNTYQLPDGSAGLLDWQLSVRGAWAHDVNYLIVTALTVEQRRAHERELLAHYVEGLRRNGVREPPSAEEAWREYRRGVIWSFYFGWLTTPVVNYGERINTLNLERTSTAFMDLDTAALVHEVMS